MIPSLSKYDTHLPIAKDTYFLKQDEEDKECCEKIIKDLLKNCEQVKFYPSRTNQVPGKTDPVPDLQAIIFRQSESWQTLEGMLNAVLKSDEPVDISAEVVASAIGYLSDIRRLRGYQNAYRYWNTRLKDLKPQETETDVLLTVTKQLEDVRKGIPLSLELFKEKLEKDLTNPLLNKSTLLQNSLNFTKEHWVQLTVFSDALEELSLDERRLVVQVRTPKTEDVDPEKHLNLSTKAIFFIAARKNSYEVEYSNTTTPTITITKTIEVTIKNKTFAPATPVVPKLVPKKTPDDIRYDFPMVVIPKKQGILEAPATSKIVGLKSKTSGIKTETLVKSITSMAGRLERVVHCAIFSVNRRISKHSFSDEIPKFPRVNLIRGIAGETFAL